MTGPPGSQDSKNYLEVHTVRFGEMARQLAPYRFAGMQVGSIGVSPFDSLAQSEYGAGYYTAIVPSSDFGRTSAGDRVNQPSLVIFDVTKDTGCADVRFDLLIMAEVLEHLFASDELILSRVRTLIRPGGLLYVSVPNAVRHVNRLKVLAGRNLFPTKDDILKECWGGYGHIREYTLKEIHELVARQFSIVKFGGFTPYGTVFQRAISSMLPSGLKSTLFVIAKKS